MFSTHDSTLNNHFIPIVAWCCWNAEVVNNIEECVEHDVPSGSVCDPWSVRELEFDKLDDNLTDLVINYAMRHRHDKIDLGIIV